LSQIDATQFFSVNQRAFIEFPVIFLWNVNRKSSFGSFRIPRWYCWLLPVFKKIDVADNVGGQWQLRGIFIDFTPFIF